MYKRLGIFGGTFDPPHIGHSILAAQAHRQLRLDQVLWVLTPDPPHKQERSISPLVERLAMLEAALADMQTMGDQAFRLSRVDIDRPPPHYAVDTVNLLHLQFPLAKLVYLMGGDSLADLPRWHTPGEFVCACDEIGVMRRPNRRLDLAELERALPGLIAKVHWVDMPLLDISSSDLRERLRAGQNCRYFLLPGVERVIRERGIYCGDR